MTPPLARTIQHLRRLARPSLPDAISDRHLLAAFAERRDEAAFAELMRRHGPLVFGVCRRVLGHSPAADDAFQAVFVLLVRKAGAGRWRPSLGPWLYAAANRIARKARVADARRAVREAKSASDPGRTADCPFDAAAAREFHAILDEELARLPERLRAPLVLCHLEDRTRDEAAALLGWSLGTLKRRRERGRALLRDRLTRRGVARQSACSRPP